mgnify:CR=1 FL=1
MISQTRLLLFLLAALMALFASCKQTTLSKAPRLFAYFPTEKPCDTLHMEIYQDGDAPIIGKSIPNKLFFETVPKKFLKEVDYVVDSSSAQQVLGRSHFALDERTEAYWVEIRQFWFHHHDLLVYDKKRKIFTDRITVAELYGGDGGQILTESWLFDYDGDGKKDLLRRELSHSIIPGEDTVLERNEEAATLLLWKNGRFEEQFVQDTAKIFKQFPIRSFW